MTEGQKHVAERLPLQQADRSAKRRRAPRSECSLREGGRKGARERGNKAPTLRSDARTCTHTYSHEIEKEKEKVKA